VRQHLEAAFHPVQMRSVVEVGHLATVTGLVSAGLGISVVPALTLFHFRQPGLTIRPLNVPGLTRELVLLTRRGESLSAAAQAFRTLMLHRKPRPGVLARELRRKKAA
jgi:LysR family carnitine catabolism transcriptional activator